MNRKRHFQPGRGYSKKDWKAVSDNPEWTEASIRAAKPFAEALPKLNESIKRSRGRPAVAKPRQQISIRLDPEVISKFKATGPKWQSKINEVLKRAKV